MGHSWVSKGRGKTECKQKICNMIIAGALATPSYIEVSANHTSTPRDFCTLPVHIYTSHSASTVVMAVFSESDISWAASKACKRLLQFRSDQTEGAEARLHPSFGLCTGSEHVLHTKTLPLHISSGKLPRCYWVSPLRCGRWCNIPHIPREHRNPLSLTRPYPLQLRKIAMAKVGAGAWD